MVEHLASLSPYLVGGAFRFPHARLLEIQLEQRRTGARTETAGASMLLKWDQSLSGLYWKKETATQYSGRIKVFSAEAAGHGEGYNTTPASFSSGKHPSWKGGGEGETLGNLGRADPIREFELKVECYLTDTKI